MALGNEIEYRHDQKNKEMEMRETFGRPPTTRRDGDAGDH